MFGFLVRTVGLWRPLVTHDSLLIHVMSCTQEQFAAAVDLDRRGPKWRLDTSRQGYLSGVPEGIARTAVTTSRTCRHRRTPPPVRSFIGRMAGTSITVRMYTARSFKLTVAVNESCSDEKNGRVW